MRVSIDDTGSAKKSSLMDDVGGGSTSKNKKSGGGGGGGLDSKQKIKAAVAVAVIVLCGGFIAWQNGLFAGKPKLNAPPQVTPEEQEAFDQNQQPKSTGGTRLPPPMPVGSN